MTVDHLSARTRRRLARSPYAPPGGTVLRSDVLARLLVERLTSLGPMTEATALEAIDSRAPGRGPDVILWAQQRGIVRRVQTDDAVMLEAVGTPQTLAA
jgi:hypothetical protein